MEELRNRIKRVLFEKDCSVSKLCGGNGTSIQVKANRQINGNTAITADIPMIVLKSFPDISPDWLMLGVGSMYRDNMRTQTNNVHVDTMSGGTAIAGNVSSSASDKSRDAMITQLLEQNNKLIQYLTSK